MATEYIYNDQTGEFEEREIQPPRFKYFRIKNRKAFLNMPCTLEWEVENASSVTLDKVGPQNLIGFFTFRPHDSSTYWTLRAHGEGDSEKTIEVKAFPLPKISSFKALHSRNNSNSFIVGDTITLKWNAEFYDEIRLNGEDVSGQSSIELKIDSELNDYELEVQSEDHIVKDRLTVTAYKKPNISITTNRDKLRQGKNENFILSWDIKDASSAIIKHDGIEESISLEGNMSFTPQLTSTYKIVAIALDGNRRFEVTKRVEVLPEADIFFAASREYTLPGVPIQLSWHVSHCKSAMLAGDFNGAGPVSFRGNKTISLESNQTIKLQVEDEFGTTESSINIRMIPIPVIKEIQVPTPSVLRNLDVQIHVTRPNLGVSIPHYSTIRTIPFVPKMNIPEMTLNTSFIELEKKIPEESLRVKGWNYINEISSSLLKKLKFKIE